MPAPIVAAAAAKSLLTPKNIKIMVIVIITIIVIVIAVKFYKNQAAKAEAKKLVGAADAEIIKNQKTLTQSDYESLANNIFIALDKTISDEEAAIRAISTLRTKTDWLSLVKAFGIKEKGVWGFKKPMNLIGWLSDELSDDNKAIVNAALSRWQVTI